MTVDVTTSGPEERETQRRVRAVKICIAASLMVCVIELALGLLLGLSSLVAEGVHTLLDGVDSVIVLVAVYIAARPADRSHPFGHGKFEALGASIEGAFVLAAAVGIGYAAIDRLIRGVAPEQIPWYVVAAMGAASAFYLLVSAYLMREARETKSPAVLAEALHLRTHIYITAGLAVGLLVGTIGHYPVIDNLLALAVAVCLLGIGIHIHREVFAQLTDAALPQDELDELKSIIEPFSDRFVEVHGVRTRRSGAERHIEMHLVVLPETSVADAHELGHSIEQAILERWPTSKITAHIEPLNTNHADREKWFKDQPKVRVEDSRPDEREFIH